MADLDNFMSDLDKPAQTQKKEADPLLDFLNGGVDQDVKLDLSVTEGLKRNSENSARVLQMQMKTGLPEDLIERNLETIEAESAKKDFNPKAYRETSDIVASWYSENPNHPAIAYRDISKLSYLERLFKHVSNRKDRGEMKREMVDLGTASFTESATKDQKARLKEIKKTLEREETFGIEGFFETLPGDIADQYPNYRDIFLSGLKGGAAGAATGTAIGAGVAAATGGAGAPLIPAFAKTGAISGFMTGGALETARTEGAHAFVEYEDMKDKDGFVMDRNMAKGAALAVGAINGGLEFMSLGVLAKTIPGVKQLQSKLGRTAVKKALQSPTLRKSLGKYFASIGAAAGTEGVTEFLQEMTTSVVGDVAVMVQDGRLEHASTEEIAAELFSQEKLARFKEAAVLGAKVGGGISVVTGGAQAGLDYKAIKDANNQEQVIINLGEGVKDTELAGKVPEKLEEVIGRTVDGTPLENINIPAQQWATYWQSKQIDPAEMYQEVAGEIENYDNALRSGEDISIPTKRYASTIARTEHNDALAEHIRFDEGVMTAFEARGVVKRFNESIEKDEQVEESKTLQSGQEIEDSIASQLKEQGYDENAAQKQGLLYRALFETGAKRTGKTPSQLFDPYNFKITSEEIEKIKDPEKRKEFFQQLPKERELSPLGFYSALEESVKEMPFKQVPVRDLKTRIAKIPGLKKEEVEWTGINEFLDSKEGKVSKEEVEEFLSSKGVVVDQQLLSPEFTGFAVGEMQWSDAETLSAEEVDPGGDIRHEEAQEDVSYYRANDPERIQEVEDQYREDFTDEDGNVDEEGLERRVDEHLYDEAYGFRTEDIERGESPYSEFKKTLEVDGEEFELLGRPESGDWYANEGGYVFNYWGSESEAEIQFIQWLKEKNLIESEVSDKDLSKEEDVSWRVIRKRHDPDLVKKSAKELRAKNRQKVIDRINEEEITPFNEQTKKEKKENLSFYSRRLVEDELESENNEAAEVEHRLNHPVIEGYSIHGNNIKGWELRKYGDLEINLQAKTSQEAKEETVNYLRDDKELFAEKKEEGERDISEPVGRAKWERYVTDGGENYREVLLTLPEIKERFNYSTHFDQDNIVAHVRLTDRESNDGKKTLYIEEVQSDWHQQGREKGYKSRIEEGSDQENAGTIPDAPFKKTDAWAGLALKRIITMAVNEGYDAVAWSPAEQHVERWGTDVIEWVKKDDVWFVGSVEQRGGRAGDVDIEAQARERGELLEKEGERVTSKEELSEVIKSTLGRERTDRSMDSLTESIWKQMQVEKTGVRKPREEGMKFFYDSLLPKTMKSIAGKVDKKAKVNVAEFDVGKEKEVYIGEEYTLQDIIDLEIREKEELDKILKDPEKVEIRDLAIDKHDTTVEITAAIKGDLEDGSSFKEFADKVMERSKDLGRYKGVHTPRLRHIIRKLGGDQYESFETQQLPLKALSLDLTEKIKETVPEKGFTLFQDKDGPRGRIRISDKEINIDLLRNADLSTFLHETGHFFLEVTGDLAELAEATQQMKDDYKALLDWFGVESRDQIKVEHHEKFAEAFERYLAEGKAPSSRLRQAFITFKEFIISAYRKLINVPGTELTDEVRKVMDRLLATDEEIKNVQVKQNQVPLFEDLRTLGFSKKDAENYQKAFQNAYDEAKEEITVKLIKDVRKSRSALYKKAWQRTKEEVTNEINERKEYIALSVLTTGKLPTGEEFSLDVKLSKEALLEMYGKDGLPKIRPFIYRKEGGMHPDTAAGILGYISGDQMIKEIAGLPKRKDAINEETDVRMEQLFPDETDLKDLRDVAEKTVENKKRGEVLLKELEILVNTDFRKFKNVTKKLTKRLPKQTDVAEEAKLSIASKRVRTIKPINYQRAQAKASREAVELLFKGDLNGAYEAKLKELYNHELYREAVKARDVVDKITKHMNKYNSNTARARIGKAGGTYLDQIDAIMERFDFRRNVSNKALDKRQSLLEFYIEQRAAGSDIHIPEELINEANKRHYKDMTLEQLVAIDSTVKNIEHLAKIKNKLLKNKKARELADVVNSISSAIEENFEVKPKRKDPTRYYLDTKIKNVKQYLSEMTKMEFIFELLDGNKANGTVWQSLFQPMAEAEDVKSKMTRESVEKLEEIYSVYTREERRNWVLNKKHYNDLGVSMTKANLLALALNQGNQYNKDAVLDGYGWNQAQVDKALEDLDKRDWDVVQKIWDHINSYWSQIEAMEKRINGIAAEKVEALPVVTKYGEYRGGYYPVLFDANIDQRQKMLEGSKEIHDIFGERYAFAATKRGHTIARQNTGGKPVLLNLTGLSKHLKNVIHDLTFREAVMDAHKIINHPVVKESIEGSLGEEIYEQLNPWLVAIASDTQVGPQTQHERIWGQIKTNATQAIMGLKLSTAYVQALGILPTMKELGIKDTSSGVFRFYKSPLKMKDFVYERSEFMKSRIQNFDRDVRELLNRLNVTGEYTGKLAWLKAYSTDYQVNFFMHIGVMDMAVSMPTWLTAYQQAIDGKIENIEKGNELEAVSFADRTVRITQGTGTVKDLAMVQRGGQLQKLFTMFYSYFSVLFNQFLKVGYQYKFDKNIMGAAKSLALLWPLAVILEDAMKGKLPDEEKDEDAYRKYFVKNLTYPFQSMVYIRDVTGALDRFDYTPSAAFDVGTRGAKVVKSGIEFIAGEKEEFTRGDLKNLVFTTGYLTGLPTSQAWLTTEYFYDWLNGEQEPDTAAEGLFRGLVIGKEYKK